MFLLAGGKFMPKMHLRNRRFIIFIKTKKRKHVFHMMWLMAILKRIMCSEKSLCDKGFNSAKN